MYERSHVVYRFAVHLPNEQMVYFHDGQEEAALQRSECKFTHLTAWFELNKIDENNREYLYSDIGARRRGQGGALAPPLAFY